MEAGSDLRLAAPSCHPGLASSWGDDSHQSFAARFAASALPAAVVGAPAFVLVSAASAAAVGAAGPAAWAAYYPAGSARNPRAVPARKPAQSTPCSLPAPATIPRIGVSVSFLVTSVDSDSYHSRRRSAPAAATRSTAQNRKSHHNFPKLAYSD